VTTLSQTGVTELLVNWSNGDQEALNKLIPLHQPDQQCGGRHAAGVFTRRQTDSLCIVAIG
jgi:hypothetical protein